MTSQGAPSEGLGAVNRLLQVATIAAALLAFLFTADLLSASGAQSCADSVSASCYPWGSEGPGAERWAYASKGNYLILGVIHLVLAIGVVAAAGPVLLKRKLSAGRHWLVFGMIVGLAAMLAF